MPIMVGALVVLVLLVGGLVAAIVTGAHVPGTKPKPATAFTVNGAFILSAGQFTTTDESSCAGSGGYDDIALGAPVTVTDASGTVVGVGQINEMSLAGDMTGVCTLDFSVDGVPAGKGFYGVEVSHRGALKYSEAALKGGPVQQSF